MLAEAAPALLECDLTGNLLPDWAAVAAVLGELQRLRVLNLTASRLAPLSSRAEPAALGPFNALRTLVLNRCGIRCWAQVRHSLAGQYPLAAPSKHCDEDHIDKRCRRSMRTQVLAIASAFSQLRELHLAGNGISALQPAVADSVPSALRNIRVRTCAVGMDPMLCIELHRCPDKLRMPVVDELLQECTVTASRIASPARGRRC